VLALLVTVCCVFAAALCEQSAYGAVFWLVIPIRSKEDAVGGDVVINIADGAGAASTRMIVPPPAYRRGSELCPVPYSTTRVCVSHRV
jgi:hypothetical protein